MSISFETIFDVIKEHHLVLAVLFFIVYRVLRRFTSSTINVLAKHKSVSASRTAFIIRCFNIFYLLILTATFLIVSGIGYGNFAIFISSVFTVVGVGFIAQWSILSNVTASFLIFFVFPYRIGDYIVVADGEGNEGTLLEIKIFHTLIKHPEGNIITYPNALLLQKSVTKVASNNIAKRNSDKKSEEKEESELNTNLEPPKNRYPLRRRKGRKRADTPMAAQVEL
ncbi:small-conductance mechanosensitive channel [Vibrio ishigakensis]|uniref:Small-conductance mechanosensitive channel n=1 Tax=Vibrio ishigakensis TaxID=1481914 RepID=A0A0B8PB95_9VIBR|nr:small-conductance mechanosensitive channel [Vibrio ishigakensis]